MDATKDRQRKRLIWICGIICFLIVFTALGNHATEDAFKVSFPYDTYVPQSGACEVDSESGNMHIWSSSADMRSIVQTTPFSIEKDEYELAVAYTSTSDQNLIRLIGEGIPEGKNQRSTILLEMVLDPATNELKIPLQVSQAYPIVTIQFQCAGNSEIRVGNTTLESTSAHFNDALFLMVLCLAGMGIVLFLIHKYESSKETAAESIYTGILLAMIMLVATMPLMSDFLIKGQDMTIHLAHIEGISSGLQNGEFPVRITGNQAYGYGYAMPVMYPDIFLYIPAVFRLFGVSAMLSYKVFLFLINVISVLLAYKSFQKLLNSTYGGIIGSAIYVLAPFRLVNLYERAALGEALAMTFLPLVVWGLYEILKGNYQKWYLASIGFACLFQSHVLTTLIVCIFSGITFLWFLPDMIRDRERICYLAAAAITSFCMVLWNAIPMLSYFRLPFKIKNESSLLHDSSVYLLQMFSNFWGAGKRGNITVGTTDGEMPLTIGVILFIGVVLFLVVYWKNKENKENAQMKMGIFFLCLGGFSLFMASWVFPWNYLQQISWIDQFVSKFQFAFRFLSITSLFWTITTTVGILVLLDKIDKKKVTLVFMSILVISVFFLQGLLEKESFQTKSALVGVNDTDQLYLYDCANMDAWKTDGMVIQMVPENAITISDYEKKGSSQMFSYAVTNPSQEIQLTIPMAYYPGYEVRCNGTKLETSLTENGKLGIQLSAPEQNGKITIQFQERPAWIAANIISVISWIGMCLLLVKKRKKVDEE